MKRLIQNIKANNLINYFLMAYAFVLPLSRAGIVLFSLLLILLWFIEGDLKEKFSKLKNNKFAIAFFIFILFNIISLLWVESQNIKEAIRYIVKYWYMLVIFVIFTSMKKEYVNKILIAFIVGMSVSIVISLGAYFEFWEFKRATASNISPFMHHIEYSIFLAITSLVLVCKAIHQDKKSLKILFAMLFIVSVITLFLTLGRAGQLSFVVTIFVLLLMQIKKRVKETAIILIIFISSIILAYNYNSLFHNRIEAGKKDIDKLINKQDYSTSWGNRVGAMIVAKEIFLENPLLGVGIIDNMDELKKIVNEKGNEKLKCIDSPHFMHFHNQYLDILTKKGLVGLLIFLSLFYFLLKSHSNIDEYKNLRIILSVVFLVGFIAEPLLHQQFTMALFAFFSGLVVSYQTFY